MPNKGHREGLLKPIRRKNHSTPTYPSIAASGLLSSTKPESHPATQAPVNVNHFTPNPQRKRLACPYRKKYPRYKPKASACLHPFADISRLKEHLYRCHMEQQQCLRCRATFDSETALETHMQATDVCQPFQQLELQVFGRDIQDKLKKRSSKKSDEEKWAGVYRTLFPKDRDIPLPHHDELPLAEYRESVQHKLPGRLKDALEKLVAPDTGVASLSEPMMVEIIKVVCACSDELLREFQHAQQHEAAQYQPLGLASSETSPQVALENSFVDTGTKGSVDMLQDMVSNWNPQQPAFPEVSMPFTMEPRSSFNGSTSINYVSQHSTSSTHWGGANAGMHQSCQSQAWYPPQWSSPYLASTGGVLASTHGQFMPMLPTLTSDFAPVGDANQASAVTGTNASFTADMSIDTFHSNSPSFEF